jgi:hypothetical protein
MLYDERYTWSSVQTRKNAVRIYSEFLLVSTQSVGRSSSSQAEPSCINLLHGCAEYKTHCISNRVQKNSSFKVQRDIGVKAQAFYTTALDGKLGIFTLWAVYTRERVPKYLLHSRNVWSTDTGCTYMRTSRYYESILTT